MEGEEGRRGKEAGVSQKTLDPSGAHLVLSKPLRTTESRPSHLPVRWPQLLCL